MNKKEEKIDVIFDDGHQVKIPVQSLEPGSKREVQFINHLIHKYKKKNEEYSVLIKE